MARNGYPVLFCLLFFSNPTAAAVALTPDEFFHIILYALWGHILYKQEVQFYVSFTGTQNGQSR